MNSPKILLSLKHICIAYNYDPVIIDLTVDIPAGKVGAIVGPNGAGKSTLLKAVLGFIKPVAGTIQWHIQKNIGYVPQRSHIDWNFPICVRDVVVMGTYGRLHWYQRPSLKEYECADQALYAVGLQDYAYAQINELSGGQQQRMFLARALAQQADWYILDEPFAAVDARSEKIIMALLKDLVKQGKSVLMVHHNLAVLEDYCDWVMVLNKRCLASGAPSDQHVKKALLELYDY